MTMRDILDYYLLNNFKVSKFSYSNYSYIHNYTHF